MDLRMLETEALKLPPHKRRLLADALLNSLDDEVAQKSETACAAEAESRQQTYVRGDLSAADGPSVFKRLRAREPK